MPKATPIPTKRREQVKARQNGRCLRCGCPNPNEWHHRRTRHVRDEHQHCSCNGVYLCTPCHHAVHHHDIVSARRLGFIVSRYVPLPYTVPVLSYGELITLDCEGGFEFTNEVPSMPEEG